MISTTSRSDSPVHTFSLAFADTQYYVTDPNVEHVPVKEMLGKVRLQAGIGVDLRQSDVFYLGIP
jgi:gamma-glutamyltranspeptidase/glutathione hydrolase